MENTTSLPRFAAAWTSQLEPGWLHMTATRGLGSSAPAITALPQDIAESVNSSMDEDGEQSGSDYAEDISDAPTRTARSSGKGSSAKGKRRSKQVVSFDGIPANERRREQNRRAQRAMRARKENYREELEQRVAEQALELEQLRTSHYRLQQEHAKTVVLLQRYEESPPPTSAYSSEAPNRSYPARALPFAAPNHSAAQSAMALPLPVAPAYVDSELYSPVAKAAPDSAPHWQASLAAALSEAQDSSYATTPRACGETPFFI